MVLMLLVILYIGIKILISSIAAQQAKYKQFLVDWLVGFALLFIMHYIMSGIVQLNAVVVGILDNDEGDSYYIGVAELADDGSGTDSSWNDVVNGTSKVLNNGAIQNATGGDRYAEFKSKRLIVEGTENDGVNYTNDIDTSTGKLDLNGKSNKRYGGAVDLKDWGDNGVVYLAASIFNHSNDNEKYANKAILKLNAMSYVRTISSFATDSYENVNFYDRGEVVEAKYNSTGLGYSAMYVCLVLEVIMFLFTYIKRVLQMAFLTMIAPIVAIMYPVDKLGDGKAQAFNTWLKDYLFNVLIQPMHLLLYTVFIVAAGELMSKNIIYGLAIYGFMIPAEKYFKKLLGFDKASTGGGGPLGGAIGHGLAMDGLGKLAGIGPFGRGRSGGDGKSKSKIKTTKNDATTGNPAGSGGSDPSESGGGTGPRSGGGTGPRSGGGTGPRSGGSTGPRSGGSTGPRSGGGTGPRSGGSSSSSGPTRRAPNSGGAPERSFLGRGLHVAGKRIARAATGGKYDYLNGRNGSWAEAGRQIVGRGVVQGITRGLGIAAGGAIGLTAGVATAMATGDINNVWKGATVGVGAGNKISSNLFNTGADFIEDFAHDMRQELANEDSDAGRAMTRDIRNEEAFQKLDEDIYTMSDTDRSDAIDTIEHYAQFVDFDSIKDVNAMTQIRDESINGRPVDEAEAVKLYKEAKGFDVATNRRAYIEKRMRDQINDPDYEDAINDVVRRHKEVEEAQASPVEPEVGTPAEIEAAKRRNRYRNDAKYARAMTEYASALNRSAIVERAQGKMK